LRIGRRLMRGKRLPFPSTPQIRLLAMQTAPLLGRQTMPKMPHVQQQPQIRRLELPIGLLGQPLGASLDPPPRPPVAPCCNPCPLLLFVSPSLPFNLTSRCLYPHSVSPHGVSPRSARPSLPGRALDSGRAVLPTLDTVDHRWDLASGGDAGDIAASGAAIPLVATNIHTTAAVGDSGVSGGATSVTVHVPSDTVCWDIATNTLSTLG
jgi:hypothetical protein